MKTKISHLITLLFLVTVAVWAEQAFLTSMQIENDTYNRLAYITIKSADFAKDNYYFASTKLNQVALAGVKIPLYPGAKRLTFDQSNLVRYRIDAPLAKVMKFYLFNLTNRGWSQYAPTKTVAVKSAEINKLTISFQANPYSGKTEVIYAYLPADQAKVLGIEFAQNTPPPAPDPNQAGTPTPPPTGDQPPLSPTDGSQSTLPNNQPQPPTPYQSETNQTCRVNGVDMPGPCSMYAPNTQTIPFGQPKMDQQNPPDQQGPSEEEMKKMDEQRFQEMKRGLSQFAKGVKMMQKSITKTKTAVAKCGVNLPEELTNAMANANSVIEKVKAAQTADELEEIVSDVEDIGSVMQDWGPRMGDLHRLCQMIKQADKDIKQLDRSVKRVEARDKANKKIDLSEVISKFKEEVAQMRQVLNEVKELAKTDPEAALEKLEDDFYANMDNIRNTEATIDTALNISQGIKQVERDLKTLEKQINLLKKKKVDTSEVQTLFDSLKSQLVEIKNLIKGDFDPEDLIDKVETAFNAKEELQDALQVLGVGPQMMPQIQVMKGLNIKIDLPQAFQKTEGNGEEMEGSTNLP